MKSPNTKAVNMVTRCDSFRHQKATTNNSKSGAGCHQRQGKSAIIQIKIRVNQMKNRPDGRLKGDESMGCSPLTPERVGAAIWGRVSGLRTMGRTGARRVGKECVSKFRTRGSRYH